jgi:2-methylcitrate dehydratase PrpD
MRAHDLTPARVASARVGLSKTVYDMHGALAWNDKFKALLSTPYVTSVVLHDRRCWLEQFEPKRYQDPAVGAFARERVKVEIDPRVESTGAAVEIRTVDGAVHTDRRNAPKGDPTDPLTRAEIEEKLLTAAAGFMSGDAVKRIIALVAELDSLRDVRELISALRVN